MSNSCACPICFEPFEGKKIRASPSNCDHIFCIDCLQKWIKTDNVCPIDRKKFNKIINLDFNTTIKVKPKKRKRRRDYYDVSVHCEVCNESTDSGVLLLCDSCDLAYHCECLTPPLADIPPNRWHCPVCVDVESRLRPKKTTRQGTKSSDKSEKEKGQKERHENRKNRTESHSRKLEETYEYVRRKQHSQRQAASKSRQNIANCIMEENVKEDDDSNDLIFNFEHQPGPSASTYDSIIKEEDPSVSSNAATKEASFSLDDCDFQIGDSDFMDTSSDDSESDDISKAVNSFYQQEKISDEETSEEFLPHLMEEDAYNEDDVYQDFNVGIDFNEEFVEKNSSDQQELDKLDTIPILKVAESSTESTEQSQEQSTDFSIKQNIEDDLELPSDMPFLISSFKSHIENGECNTESLAPVNEQKTKGTESQTSQVILENTVSNGYISQLQSENKRLHLLLASLNRHPIMEVSNPIKSLRKENKKLKDIQSKLEKEVSELKVEAKMFTSLESRCQAIETLVKDFKHSLTNQQVDISNCIQLEHRLNSTKAENQNFQKLVDSSEQEMKNLQQNVENNSQKLSPVVENLQHVKHIITLEKGILCHRGGTDKPENSIDTNSTSSSVSESISFGEESSSNSSLIIDPKLTLNHSKNLEGLALKIDLDKEISSKTSNSSSPGKNNFMQCLKENRNRLKTIISKYEYSPTKQKENEARKSVITHSKVTKEDTIDNIESSVMFNTSNTATSAFESNSSGSEKTSSTASFVAIHKNEINHTKKCRERSCLKNGENDTKSCDVSSSSSENNDCLGTCILFSSSFKQFLDKFYTTSTSSPKESLNDGNGLSENVKNEEANVTMDINISPNKMDKNAMESGIFKDNLPVTKHKHDLNSLTSEINENDCTMIDEDSSSSLQDTDDSSTDSNFPDCDKAILLKLPLRLSFKRTPNNSPRKNSKSVSSTSATANISQKISEMAKNWQHRISEMDQPSLQTSHSNCDSLLSKSANNKRPHSFSIPIAVSLIENASNL